MNNEKLYEKILNQLKSVNTDLIKKDYKEEELVKVSVIKEQKTYFWIRLYLKEENENIQIDDDIIIRWIPSGEQIECKFIYYGKKSLNKDYDQELIKYSYEDDKTILSLMIDSDIINKSDDIPFIRTLFKIGNYYEYQLIKREELVFINKRTNTKIDYIDCNF